MLPLRHIPVYLVATAMTFGGLMPFWNAEYAMLEFGLPARIASSQPAHPVMIISSARTSALGALIFIFMLQEKFAEVDTLLSVLVYLGCVDAYICWREQMPGKAAMRFVSGTLIAMYGWFGLTAGG